MRTASGSVGTMSSSHAWISASRLTSVELRYESTSSRRSKQCPPSSMGAQKCAISSVMCL